MARLELFYPLKPYYLNQAFGVNGEYYRKHGINVLGHNGLDLLAKHGQPVYASHDGVAYHEVDNSSGCGVVLISNEQFEYDQGVAYVKTIYWHLCDYTKEPKFKSPVLDYQQKNKAKGMFVKRGDLIGYADNTGLSDGDHTHWGLKAVKPGSPIGNGEDAADVGIGNWTTLNYSNGYLGALNPAKYLNGKYAQDTDQIAEAEKIVKAVDDLTKVETPQNTALISVIVSSLWASFLALFTPKK